MRPQTTKNSKIFIPLFKAVKDYVVQAPEKTTGWYLPSIGQWYDFTANLGGLPSWDDAINEGNDLTPNLYRWSNQTELVSKINAYFEPLGTGNYDAIPNGSYQKFFSSSTYSDSGIWTWFVGKQANVVQCWHNVRYNSDSAVRPILAFKNDTRGRGIRSLHPVPLHHIRPKPLGDAVGGNIMNLVLFSLVADLRSEHHFSL